MNDRHIGLSVTTSFDEESTKSAATRPSKGRFADAPLCVVVLSTLIGYPAQNTQADIIVNPWRVPVVEEFDSNDPPADLGTGNSDADADATFKLGLGFPGGGGSNWDRNTNTLTVTSMGTITLSGYTHIRVPDDASAALREHEQGHDRLNRYEYEQRAKEKLETAMRGYEQSAFAGEGATDRERYDNAHSKAEAERNKRLTRAMDAIKKQMVTLNAKYDKLTEHGTNLECDTAKGEQEAKKERSKASEAGDALRVPDDAEQSAGTADPSQICFDPETAHVTFCDEPFLDHAFTVSDSIVGRGQVCIDAMTLIGVQENGTILLSDTSMQIVDAESQEVLLDGFLFEIAYMAVDAPGSGAVIQAYLDVPPVWASGVNNAIGSEFLAGIQVPLESGDRPMVWINLDTPLFDENAQPLPLYQDVAGTLRIGVVKGTEPIPSLSTWGLVVLGLGLLAIGRIVFTPRDLHGVRAHLANRVKGSGVVPGGSV